MRVRNALQENIHLYLFIFVICSVIGWIYEVVLALLYGWGFVNRGFLVGPYLPIYGFGALTLFLLLYENKRKPKYLGKVPVKPVIIFLLIVLIATGIEYIVSYLMELIFHQRWWDYSEDFLNINGRVCLRTSFRFGIGGMLFLYVLAPLIILLDRKIPQKNRNLIYFSVILLPLIDFICVIAGYLIHT